MNFIERFKMMQLDVNHHKVDIIIGCNIVYVMFFMIFNNIRTHVH